MNKGSLPFGIVGFARLSCCLLALCVSTTSSGDGSVVWFDGDGGSNSVEVDSSADHNRDIGKDIWIFLKIEYLEAGFFRLSKYRIKGHMF